MCLLGGVAVVGRTWDVPEPAPPAAGQVEAPSGDELETARAEVLRRIEAKREAVEEVLAGRLAPGEAADLFRTFKEDLRRRYLQSHGPIPTTPSEDDQLCGEGMMYARDALRDRNQGRAQAPDLLMYAEDLSDWFFCEVKGPGDRLRDEQVRKFELLANMTSKPVRLLEFRLD